MKALYAQVAGIYPPRFQRVDDWCAFARGIYIQTRKVDAAFGKADTESAQNLLPEIRQAFDAMHIEAQQLKCNDRIYAFWKEVNSQPASPARLKGLLGAIVAARPLLQGQRRTRPPTSRTKEAWAQAANAALSDSALSPEELTSLKEATETFYRAYGIQFE